MSYPVVQSTKKLKSFLTEISSRGIPDKITFSYLSSIGYKSSNDRQILTALKHINLLNSDGAPNENYVSFRDETISKKIMAKLIREAYSELYKDYPNAHLEDRSKLDNWFKTKMGIGDRTAQRVTNAFTTLSEYADFTAIEEKEEKKEEEKDDIKKEAEDILSKGVEINLNIQLVLPATENVEVYEKIFKSLKENILK